MYAVSVKANAQPPHLIWQPVYSALAPMACIGTACVKCGQLDMQTAVWLYRQLESICICMHLLIWIRIGADVFVIYTDKTLSKFDGMISTSNHISEDTVTVETDADVIWITETAK